MLEYWNTGWEHPGSYPVIAQYSTIPLFQDPRKQDSLTIIENTDKVRTIQPKPDRHVQKLPQNRPAQFLEAQVQQPGQPAGVNDGRRRMPAHRPLRVGRVAIRPLRARCGSHLPRL